MRSLPVRSLLSSKALPFVIVPLIALVMYHFGVVVYKSLATDRDIGELQRQVEELEESQKRLQEFNAFLNSDFFAEKEARIKLGMQKEGEQLVLLPKSVPDSANLAGDSEEREPASAETLRPKSNPELWWEYFFGK